MISMGGVREERGLENFWIWIPFFGEERKKEVFVLNCGGTNLIKRVELEKLV